MTATRIVALAILLHGPALSLASETLGVLPVAPPPGPSPELIETTAQLRKVIAERNPGVLDAQQLRDRMTGQVPGATPAEIDRAFGTARAASLAGDYEGSIRILRAILDELEKLPDGEETFAQWQRAMLRLARAESDLGHADTTRGLLEQLVRASPQVQADPAQFPPRFVRLVDDARAWLRGLPVHRLSVTSPVPGARVHVDGRDVGAAPLEVPLAEGRYRVSGALGAARTPSITAELSSGDASVALDFTVPDSLRPNLGPGLALPEADRARALVAVGGLLRLDSLLAASFVTEGGASYLSGALYDVRRGILAREGRVRLAQQALPVGGATALGDYLVTGQATSALVEIPGVGPARPDLRAPEPPPPGSDLRLQEADKGPPRTSALGWTAFGTGIATLGLAGVSIWQVTVMNGNYDSANSMNGGQPPVDPNKLAQYNQYLSAGDSAKTTAIVTGVAAGACAVGTVILAVIAKEIGPIRF